MNFFQRLFNRKKKSKIFTDEEIVVAGACPNCWGYQDYDSKFIEYYSDQTKANINHDKSHQKAFIQQFVETHVTGIKLKNNNCLKCQRRH